MSHHVAQINVSRRAEPLGSPRLAEFVPVRESMTALWWVPAGTLPAVADGEQRLRHLRAHGPTPVAFTFRVPFPSPDGISVVEDEWFCPA